MTAPGRIGEATFPGRPESVADARAFVRRALIARYGTVLEDVVLLVSELLGNAVRHSDSGRLPGGVVTVTLSEPADGVIRVEVRDAGSPRAGELRAQPDVDENSEGGRGLYLVDLLADKWGSHLDDDGLVVWFEISFPPDKGRRGLP
ncbi:ATP-binding protein [Thermopolyspora sp. NPDC052614]|uniref:ATP-binding protein n=1 Tax=Thermopolyspora sp. NPDC052614 TaxID=3155682 RepID=UPI003418B469